MKTFEEAFAKVIFVTREAGDQTPVEKLPEIQDILRLQEEYKQEVYACPQILIISQGIVHAIVMKATEGGTKEGNLDLQRTTYDVFCHGVMLGVAIGIQMERNELPQEQVSREQGKAPGEVVGSVVGLSGIISRIRRALQKCDFRRRKV